MLYTQVKFEIERKHKRKSKRIGSMLTKIGICAASAALVLQVSYDHNSSETRTYSYASVDAMNDEYDIELGKLKFVTMPGIIEVFAPLNESVVSVDYKDFQLIRDGSAAKLYVNPGDSVSVSAAVYVTSIYVSDNEKLALKLKTTDMTDICVEGFETIFVEQGQYLQKQDLLGSTTDSALTVYVSKSGRLLDPMDYVNNKVIGED